jgi:hypothetical protein
MPRRRSYSPPSVSYLAPAPGRHGTRVARRGWYCVEGDDILAGPFTTEREAEAALLNTVARYDPT